MLKMQEFQIGLNLWSKKFESKYKEAVKELLNSFEYGATSSKILIMENLTYI